jgi:hypothetical protein
MKGISKESSPHRLEYKDLAYKIYFREKRSEIIHLRVKAYDEYRLRRLGRTQVATEISLPQLSLEIDQMWGELSSQDRKKFQSRAIVEMRRDRFVTISSNISIPYTIEIAQRQTLSHPVDISLGTDAANTDLLVHGSLKKSPLDSSSSMKSGLS